MLSMVYWSLLLSGPISLTQLVVFQLGVDGGPVAGERRDSCRSWWLWLPGEYSTANHFLLSVVSLNYQIK